MKLSEYLKNPTDLNLGIQFFDAFYKPGRWIQLNNRNMAHHIALKHVVYDLKKLVVKRDIELNINPVNVVHHASTPAPVVEPAPVQQPFVYTEDRAGKEMQARDLYRKVGKLRADLFSDNKEVRRIAALEIKSSMKLNRKLWAAINQFDATGKWPDAKDDVIEDVNIDELPLQELIAMSKNLAPWCSKEKKKIQLETDPEKKAAREKLLLNKLALLDQVKTKLSEA